MELRPLFTPVIGPERIKLIESRIREIEEALENDRNVDALITGFNELTGKAYDKYYFQTYWKDESREEFAHQAALPVAVKVNDITKEELIEIVDRIIAADPHTSFFLDVLKANVPHPRVSNLIFRPQKEGLTSLPTSEEIVTAALRYQPTQV